jgi:hypothetical protein
VAREGPGAVGAQSPKVLRCPADALPADGAYPYYAPGELAFLPEGYYVGLTSYGANWEPSSTRGDRPAGSLW